MSLCVRVFRESSWQAAERRVVVLNQETKSGREVCVRMTQEMYEASVRASVWVGVLKDRSA